jgi:hypothetical protein
VFIPDSVRFAVKSHDGNMPRHTNAALASPPATLQVSTCKAGKLNDACFDKLKPLYCNGEPFVEQLKSALQQKNASLKKNVTDKAWKVNTLGAVGARY